MGCESDELCGSSTKRWPQAFRIDSCSVDATVNLVWSIANTEGCLYGGDASSPVTSLRSKWLRYGTAFICSSFTIGALGFGIEKPLSMQAMSL